MCARVCVAQMSSAPAAAAAAAVPVDVATDTLIVHNTATKVPPFLAGPTWVISGMFGKWAKDAGCEGYTKEYKTVWLRIDTEGQVTLSTGNQLITGTADVYTTTRNSGTITFHRDTFEFDDEDEDDDDESEGAICMQELVNSTQSKGLEWRVAFAEGVQPKRTGVLWLEPSHLSSERSWSFESLKPMSAVCESDPTIATSADMARHTHSRELVAELERLIKAHGSAVVAHATMTSAFLRLGAAVDKLRSKDDNKAICLDFGGHSNAKELGQKAQRLFAQLDHARILCTKMQEAEDDTKTHAVAAKRQRTAYHRVRVMVSHSLLSSHTHATLTRSTCARAGNGGGCSGRGRESHR